MAQRVRSHRRGAGNGRFRRTHEDPAGAANAQVSRSRLGGRGHRPSAEPGQCGFRLHLVVVPRVDTTHRGAWGHHRRLGELRRRWSPGGSALECPGRTGAVVGRGRRERELRRHLHRAPGRSGKIHRRRRGDAVHLGSVSVCRRWGSAGDPRTAVVTRYVVAGGASGAGIGSFSSAQPGAPSSTRHHRCSHSSGACSSGSRSLCCDSTSWRFAVPFACVATPGSRLGIIPPRRRRGCTDSALSCGPGTASRSGRPSSRASGGRPRGHKGLRAPCPGPPPRRLGRPVVGHRLRRGERAAVPGGSRGVGSLRRCARPGACGDSAQEVAGSVVLAGLPV